MRKFTTAEEAFKHLQKIVKFRHKFGVTTMDVLFNEPRITWLILESLTNLQSKLKIALDVLYVPTDGHEWETLIAASELRVSSGLIKFSNSWHNSLLAASEALSGLDIFLYGPSGQINHDNITGNGEDGWLVFVNHSWPRPEHQSVLLIRE